MIPKIIHQIWLGTKPVPAVYMRYAENWRRKNPGWEYRVWHDHNIDEFGQLDMLARCDSPAARSDVIRIAAVYRYGGVYVDMDTDCVQCFDPLCQLEAFSARDDANYYAGVFGAEPKHPWTQWQIDHLAEYAGTQMCWVLFLMTKAAEQCGHCPTTLPFKTFYPYHWTEGPFPTENFPEAMAVHHWAMSWNPNSRRDHRFA